MTLDTKDIALNNFREEVDKMRQAGVGNRCYDFVDRGEPVSIVISRGPYARRLTELNSKFFSTLWLQSILPVIFLSAILSFVSAFLLTNGDLTPRVLLWACIPILAVFAYLLTMRWYGRGLVTGKTYNLE